MPLVDVLVAGGNRVIRGGFHKDVDGWRCELADPLDFELLRKKFRFPESICLAPVRDLVICRRSWAAIVGGKARSNSEVDLEAHGCQPELVDNVYQLAGVSDPSLEAKPLLTLVQGKAADETGGRSRHGQQRATLAIAARKSRR